MKTAVYVRVSSKSQKEASQLPDLERWVASQGEDVEWYRDAFSGTTMQRPGFDRLLADVRLGKINRIVVWRLDRLGRTAVGLHQLLAELRAAKCGFVSLRDGLDLSTPTGRMVFGMLASIAEYETEVRRERQQAGIDARRNPETGKCPWGGREQGATVKVTPEIAATVRQLKAANKPIAAIARIVKLSRVTIYAILKAN